jgi:zinc-ribbon domain
MAVELEHVRHVRQHAIGSASILYHRRAASANCYGVDSHRYRPRAVAQRPARRHRRGPRLARVVPSRSRRLARAPSPRAVLGAPLWRSAYCAFSPLARFVSMNSPARSRYLAICFRKVVAMRCTKCGTENAAGARFCNQCATPLSRACPKCAHLNAPDAVSIRPKSALRRTRRKISSRISS